MKNIMIFAAALLVFAACSKDEDGNSGNSIKNNEIKYVSASHEVIEPTDGYGENLDFGAEIISNTYKNNEGTITFNREVTRIPRDAFYYEDNLVAITLPNSIERIEKYAFMSTGLLSVVIPANVSYIGDWAFGYIEQDLTTVEFLPLVPPAIGDDPFKSSSPELIYVPAKAYDMYKDAYKDQDWCKAIRAK